LSADPSSGEITGPLAALVVVDPATVPDEPPPELFYQRKVHLFSAIREMWSRREIIAALAERDIRVSYKQAYLGMAWAIISPLLQVILFTLIFGRVKALKPPEGIPYAIYAYVGIMGWVYFAGSLAAGGNSMIANLNLLQKTHFPRECFPLSQLLEQMFYTTIGLIPLVILFFYNGFIPHIQGLWIPVILTIEILFATGTALMMASLIVYVRDFQQVMSIILQLGLFATPVIWPLDKLRNVTFGPFHHVDFRPLYSFINPLGPVIDSVRRTLLQGLNPDWKLLGIAAVSASLYFVFGYRIFKRLEVGFADIS
jgi:ABC-2 type transport system permease protein/lipopolysaccharide transport system permease protein